MKKADHRRKASCGLEYRNWKKQTTDKKQAVVWNLGIEKSRPQIKSKLWSGIKDMEKADHIEKVSCGPELRIWKKQTTDKKQVVVRNLGIEKSRPQIKSKLWSGIKDMEKADHR